MPRSFRTRKLSIAAGIIILGAAAAFWRFHRRPGPPAPQYTVYNVSRGDLAKVVMTTGQLAPLVCVEVSTQISGLITEVAVDFNPPVKKGQILARIDPAT